MKRLKPTAGRLVQPYMTQTVHLGSMFFGDHGSRRLGLIIETQGTRCLVWCADNFDVWVLSSELEVLA